MHHPRLVGGLVSLAALLTVLLAPHAFLAASAALSTPTPDAAPAPSPAISPVTSPAPYAGATPALAAVQARLTKVARREQGELRSRLRLIHVARRQLGVPYVYGGASRGGFDCSGLTMYVYARLGLGLPHGATDQARRGQPVSLRHLEPGDLVFYGGSGYYYHVAIYAGRGRVIHAPHTGAVVSYAPVGDAATARRLIVS
jgi:cell wall-associated NlpC family hydrolase